MNDYITRLTFLICLVFLASCGSGSGGVSSNPGDSSGFVTISVGDDDIDDFDQAIFEISRVSLLGSDEQGDEQIVLLDELRTIDFLALETVNEVLAEAEVPAGEYSKIRFAVNSITLIKLNGEGAADDELVDVRLVANGKVDIVPRGEFAVEPNSTLALDIDIDLEKSIKLTSTGSGRYIFRPVIFANVISEMSDGRIVRIEGEFESVEIDSERQSDRFKICAPELMSDDDNVVESQSCRLVLLDDTTALFEADSSLLPTTIDSYFNGDNIVVYGLLSPQAYEYGSTEYLGTPLAALVAAQGDFEQFEGDAASTYDNATETFAVELAPGQGIVGDLLLPTALPISDGALLIDSEGKLLDTSVINVGVEVEMEGLLALGVPNSFEAFIALVKPNFGAITITGMATDIDLVARTLIVTNGVDTTCVAIGDDTAIQLIDSTDEVASVNSVSLESLLNAEIEVTGSVDPLSGCLSADSIILDESPIL